MFVYWIINLYFSKVLEKIKKSLYILRYFFVIYFFNEGVDLNVVKELLGYVSLVLM